MRIWQKAVVLVLAGYVAAPCVSAYCGEHDILLAMTEKADLIARITVTNLTVAPPLHEAGVDHWTARCRVVEPIKGVLKKDQKISIIGKKIVGFDEKTDRFTNGKDYLVFLQARRGSASRPYRLVDRWVGALPFDAYLIKVVKLFVKNQEAEKEKTPVQHPLPAASEVTLGHR